MIFDLAGIRWPFARRLPREVAAIRKAAKRAVLREIRIVRQRRQASRHEPIMFSVVRDEEQQLPDFLDHHRRRGIGHFVIIDNGSEDRSLDLLVQQPDVDVWLSLERFTSDAKQAWLQNAITRYARAGSWFAYADADERIVYHRDHELTFAQLAERLAGKGIRHARAVMVDVYRVDGSSDLHFDDWAAYREIAGERSIFVHGGPRRRVFGALDSKFDPQLTKYPLFRRTRSTVFHSAHLLWPWSDNFSERYLGILHLKLATDIREKVRVALAEKQYWDESYEYAIYDEALRRGLYGNFASDLSRPYRSSDDLVNAGLIKPIG